MSSSKRWFFKSLGRDNEIDGWVNNTWVCINVHGREELLLSVNHCSPTIHCQYSYECSRGYIFLKKIWDSEERNVDMILY